MENCFKGCLLGLACGDAVGTAVEFCSRGSFELVTDMVGGGPFNLRPGEWTDDTSMALCLAVSLLESGKFDPMDQMERYCRWREEGYLSSNGRCFDIGNTVREALDRFKRTGEPYSGPTHPHSAGNGSLMRLAPVPMYYVEDPGKAVHYSGESSRTTHGALEAVDACRLFGVMLALALKGEAKEDILFQKPPTVIPLESLAPAIAAIARGSYIDKFEDDISSTGYVVHSLEAALWCFYTTDNFRDAILKAANLGGDADTIAAICGQIAGAYYGVEGIPQEWLDKLAHWELIGEMAVKLYEKRQMA